MYIYRYPFFFRYFSHLKETIKDVPAESLLNYDETNFTDDPGVRKLVFARGVKHPERIQNYSKGAISVMFSATSSGKLLPPFVVYKAQRLWRNWCQGGPKKCRYAQTVSGWFDAPSFEEWFITVVLPWAKERSGKKVIIGDNLSSHISPGVAKKCTENNISFVFLPANSTHITQPLDVAVFRPIKGAWRKIVEEYKTRNPTSTSLEKSAFPGLLKRLIEDLTESGALERNVKAGFAATGICPFDPDKVLSKLPDHDLESSRASISDSLLNFLQSSRKRETGRKEKRRKLNVPAGKSVSEADFHQEDAPETDDDNENQDLDTDTSGDEDVNDVRTNDIYQGDWLVILYDSWCLGQVVEQNAGNLKVKFMEQVQCNR